MDCHRTSRAVCRRSNFAVGEGIDVHAFIYMINEFAALIDQAASILCTCRDTSPEVKAMIMMPIIRQLHQSSTDLIRFDREEMDRQVREIVDAAFAPSARESDNAGQ